MGEKVAQVLADAFEGESGEHRDVHVGGGRRLSKANDLSMVRRN